ncbi:5-oxoprolinase subunit B family protein [Planktotalea sp.]|uniref:5-oxoprolinase subunit B family protein n=1 Tax=Planktotalea sp. TaxID=2029877 RepID=UPI003D6C2570
MRAVDQANFPSLTYIGVEGVLVRFGDRVTDAINRAALKFHAHMNTKCVAGVLESAPSLTAVYLRLDLLSDLDAVVRSIQAEMAAQDWFSEDVRAARHWTIPCCFDGPQLSEAAHLAGLSESAAVEELTQQQVRVLTIGFAPGQPYLGNLPQNWNFPRLSEITPLVPARALVAAVGQLILFANDTPTGWRHVGATEFHCFKVDRPEPFAFRVGDLVRFEQAGRAEIEALANSSDGLGGARCEAVT